MQRLLALVAVVSWAPALWSCGGESNAAPLPLEAQFAVLAEGGVPQGGAFTKKQAKVISSQVDYATELVVYTNAPTLSPDFSTGRVLLVDMGPRSTGGYSVRVASVDVASDWVVANIELVMPGPRCIVTTALTNPYQFVFIPTVREILLSEKLVVANC